MESDKHDGWSRLKNLSTKHGFLITAFGGGVYIALIIVAIVYSKQIPEISMFDRDYHIIAVLGAYMIAQTLLSVAFAYLTTKKNPSGKFLQCFGCCMTEGEIPQNITPPGTGVACRHMTTSAMLRDWKPHDQYRSWNVEEGNHLNNLYCRKNFKHGRHELVSKSNQLKDIDLDR